MVSKEEIQWNNYINNCDEKNILDFKSGEIAYIDTHNANQKPGETNHKFRPVIIIQGDDFKNANISPRAVKRNNRIEKIADDMPHATTYFIPLTTSHDNPPKYSQEYDFPINNKIINYFNKNIKPHKKQIYVKTTNLYCLNFETACNMEDKNLNNVKHIGFLTETDTNMLLKQIEHQARTYESDKEAEHHPYRTGFNKITQSTYQFDITKNPTVDYYNYKHPDSNLYNKPAHNQPKPKTNNNDLEL